MTKRGGLNGNIVVHTLMWLGRTPEEFAPGHRVPGSALPHLQQGLLPRWDGEALFAALDALRAKRGLTWVAAAREIGGYTAGTLRNVQRGVGFPSVMRLLAWLERPAADFVINVPV